MHVLECYNKLIDPEYPMPKINDVFTVIDFTYSDVGHVYSWLRMKVNC